jgi:hypothetical protein
MKDGKRAAEAKDWKRAYELFLQAWRKKPSYDIAGNLGHVALLLDKHAEAARYLAYSLRHAPFSAEKGRQATERAFERARSKVGAIELRVQPNDAEVSVDGEPYGSARKLPPEVFVEPGEHNIEASLAGHSTETRRVAAGAGSSVAISLQLRPLPASAVAEGSASSPTSNNAFETRSTTPPADPGTSLDRSSGVHAGYIALGVGGGLTLGAGIGTILFALKGSAADDDAQRHLAQARRETGTDNPCEGANGSSESCDNLRASLRDSDSANQTADILLVTTVLFAASTATATYLLWPRNPKAQASIAIYPSLAQPGGGLLLRGHF